MSNPFKRLALAPVGLLLLAGGLIAVVLLPAQAAKVVAGGLAVVGAFIFWSAVA